MSTFRLPRNAQIWLPGYFASVVERVRRVRVPQPVDIMLCVADHFEPAHGSASPDTAANRVAAWVERFPRLVAGLADADGIGPQHTFFFPEEQYSPRHLDSLAALCRAGHGEVEIHLHHDRDTSANLRETLERFSSVLLARHGLLRRDRAGRLRYAFIHGNWTLDNALGNGRWCGVDDELTILRETGCYADFTMPSAPHPAQTRTVNSIYYAIDDPQRPKSHDRGIRVGVDRPAPVDGLLMVQGPLTLHWSGRRRIMPRLDNASLDSTQPPDISRLARWIAAGISVEGRPEWIFVKLHTHGAVERNAAVLLGKSMSEFHRAALREYNDGERFRLHYVTAREMVNIIKAAEAGESGNAGRYRNYSDWETAHSAPVLAARADEVYAP